MDNVSSVVDAVSELRPYIEATDCQSEIDKPTSNHVALASQHGFAGLVYTQLAKRPDWQNTPSYKKLRQATIISEATAQVRLDELQVLLQMTQQRQLSMLILKGAAFAHQIYQSPGLRPSSDIDLYIDEAKTSEYIAVLTELGYEVVEPKNNSLISFQFSATKVSNTGHTLVLDLHTRINNQAQYERFFDYLVMFDNSIKLPQISPDAQTLCFADAIAFACVHLQGHLLQGDPIKGVWLYDIHLLLQAMSEQDEVRFVTMLNAQTNGNDLGNVCCYWVDLVESLFATQVPSRLQVCLSDYSASDNASAINPIRLLWNQFVYLPNSKSKWLFIKQLFIPEPQRIYDKYPDSALWLPLLYVRRAITGFWSRLLKMVK